MMGNIRNHLILFCFCVVFSRNFCFAQEIKESTAAGKFYPQYEKELSVLIDQLLGAGNTLDGIKEDVLALILPHAGYDFSGRTAAKGYNKIRNKHYDTVIILGTSHYSNFKGAALWGKGVFSTPLGKVEVDGIVSDELKNSCPLFFYYPLAYNQEHSVEVQIPFLQKSLDDFGIVPILLGRVDYSDCEQLADSISGVIKGKKCLIIASSDMYHGYNYQICEEMDNGTLSLIKELKAKELYDNIKSYKSQLCGAQGVVIAVLLANRLGYEQVEVIDYTNSSLITNKRELGDYCVGYSSVVFYKKTSSFLSPEENKERGGRMLNENQKKRLLAIARKTIETYLKDKKKLEVDENDPVLMQKCGAFVTLHNNNRLRGCIGSIIGRQPLYLTVRDMAIESACNDKRFPSLKYDELEEIEIEISVLSPLEQIDNIDKIELGRHGVLVRNGFQSGVFLPQVAAETGWSKEEFLSNLCSSKAGLSPKAWKDVSTEIYIFTAEVFSE